jgi:hypothetical protein
LARAFSRQSAQAGRLLNIAFDKVYSFAERSDLGEDDWGVVSEIAQPPRWWLAWDRCGTLRFTVATLCREGVITPDDFVNCTGSDATFGALLDELSQHWWGREFLKRAVLQVRPGSPRRALIEDRR